MAPKASFEADTQRVRPPQLPRRATVRMQSQTEEGLEERLALLTCAFAKGSEAALLAGLVDSKRQLAQGIAEEAGKLSSSGRAARIAKTFQERAEARERARRVVGEAAPGLAQALLAELPPFLRPEGHVLHHGPAQAPQLKRFAVRLVQEAIR